jgi:hypothetical protein
MGMFQGSSCSDPMIFKDEDVSKTLVAPEIDDSLTVDPQDVFYIF